MSSSTKISTKSKRAMLPGGYHLLFIMADAHLKSDNPYQEMTAELSYQVVVTDEMNSYPVVSTANPTEPCTVSRQPVKISGHNFHVKKLTIILI